MASCVIFGGGGFIGTHLARHLLNQGHFDHIHLADIRPSPLAGTPGITVSKTDVRGTIPVDLTSQSPSWIFNLAAVHREPGHEPSEYFETNLPGAEHVCDYASQIGCRNLYFTSSISVYGPTTGPTSEQSEICPVSPYGGSKYPAEWIHRAWLAETPDRRLIICRPGVVYGPGDPGNILRMIRAIKRGYFAFPGSGQVYKSYAYIYGLLDSMLFCMKQTEQLIVYNYVETPTERLVDVVGQAKSFLGSRAPVLPLPLWLLAPAATVVTVLTRGRSPLHPRRVQKAAMSTHIVPAWLIDHGFDFKYPFLRSLEHWRSVCPADFN
jgi:nucleoside-diphosphate-sugar epimerase